VVLCYPSHSTHVYQGLDVVIFSALKRTWSDEQDHFKCNGSQDTKSNFIGIYAKVHVRAFMPKNIKSAFAKTGIIPYNPNVMTMETMAPSIETSQRSMMPLPLVSPVRELASLIAERQACKRTASEMEHSPSAGDMLLEHSPIQRAMGALASTSAQFLVSNSPISSSSNLPPIATTLISPPRKRQHVLLALKPKTKHERHLQDAL
jgi:hypothetical protein